MEDCEYMDKEEGMCSLFENCKCHNMMYESLVEIRNINDDEEPSFLEDN